jgi:hypothetical protein
MIKPEHRGRTDGERELLVKIAEALSTTVFRIHAAGLLTISPTYAHMRPLCGVFALFVRWFKVRKNVLGRR